MHHRYLCTLRGKLQNGLDLFAGDAEFFHEFVNTHVLKISNTVETGIRVCLKTQAPRVYLECSPRRDIVTSQALLLPFYWTPSLFIVASFRGFQDRRCDRLSFARYVGLTIATRANDLH